MSLKIVGNIRLIFSFFILYVVVSEGKLHSKYIKAEIFLTVKENETQCERLKNKNATSAMSLLLFYLISI